VIDDFFRLTVDMLLYFSTKTLTSPLMDSIIAAACSSLTLLSEQPIFGTLHFLRDFLAYGGDFAPSSQFDQNQRTTVPPELKDTVKRLVATHGEHLVQRIMTGMMYTFPRDCFPDASGVLLDLFHIAPEPVAAWVQQTVSMLPSGSITPAESERLLTAIRQRVQSGEIRKVRSLLQDFTNSYRRRNVAPREGLGRLEGKRFRFEG
jgi:transportin-3